MKFKVFIFSALVFALATSGCGKKKNSGDEEAADEGSDEPFVTNAGQPDEGSDDDADGGDDAGGTDGETDGDDGAELVDPCLNPEAKTLLSDVSLADTATAYTSKTVVWTSAEDDCFSIFEVAIGLSEGASDVLDWFEVPYVDAGSTAAVSGLNLADNTDYFMSIRVRADDGTVGDQTDIPDGFQIWVPADLPDLVFFANAGGDSIVDVDEDGLIEEWNTGEQILLYQDGAAQPSLNEAEGAVEFDGDTQYFEIDDTIEVNLAVYTEKTIATTIKTSTDLKDRQVIFEEGGTVRGINVYIEWGHLYCGFWNIADGDGVQEFVAVRHPLEVDTVYTIILVYDYSNYVDADGPDGTFKCYVNDTETFDANSVAVAHGPIANVGLSELPITSRLHSHPGDIGVGAQDNHSYFHRNYIDPASSQPTGWDDLDPSLDVEWNPKKDSQATAYFFEGLMYNFSLTNSKSDAAEAGLIHDTFAAACGCFP